jgi:hypothetical protein
MRPIPPSARTGRPVPPSGLVPLKADWPLPDRPEPEFCGMCGSWCYHDDGSDAFCTRRDCEYRFKRLRVGK